jgi:exonuclease VII small subunit
MHEDDTTSTPPEQRHEQRSAEAPQRRRPTLWIGLTLLCALAAVGLGIWAFSAQSDADDAEAKLSAQQQESAPASSPPAEGGPETQKSYEEAKDELGETTEDIDQLEQELDEAVATAEKAEQQREDAGNALDKATAELEAVKAQSEVRRTCLRGALHALDAAFSSGGLDAAAEELGRLAGQCGPATSS